MFSTQNVLSLLLFAEEFSLLQLKLRCFWFVHRHYHYFEEMYEKERTQQQQQQETREKPSVAGCPRALHSCNVIAGMGEDLKREVRRHPSHCIGYPSKHLFLA